MTNNFFAGLEHLSTAVILLDKDLQVAYLNPSAENLFKLSIKYVTGIPLQQLFGNAEALSRAAESALATQASFTEHEILLTVPGNHSLSVSCTVSPAGVDSISLILEFHQIDKQLKIAREERMLVQQKANRELLRNLAHEIKNPLGGLRGAAQLLEYELPRTGLREYTQVIIQEADRLQRLMDRLLTPSHLPHLCATNIHEVLERVRSLTLAETPKGIIIRRDYDTSLPDLWADPEQLIQSVLNIVRNAVQSMQGNGEIILRTRIARQVTLVKKRYRQAIKVEIIDNGPGIPDALRETLFYPLVSGREGGSGMGLTLSQTLISQHQGTIECDSRSGYTCFTLMLPLTDSEGATQ